MPVWLLSFWKWVKGVPSWLWGVVLAVTMLVGMFLRMRSAEKARSVALGKAAVSKMKASTAKNDAVISVELEKIEELSKQRADIRNATEDEIAAIEDMDDAELTEWLKNDARRRSRKSAK